MDAVAEVERGGCWLLGSVLRFMFEKEVNTKSKTVQERVIRLICGLIDL